MPKMLSIWATALTILSLCSIALGATPDECVEDDILLSLQEWIVDAESFCRTRLDIPDVTTTVLVATSRTTVTTHLTTTVTKAGLSTVPTSTITLTISDFAPSGAIQKRAPRPAEAQFYQALPFAREIANGSADDELIARVSSGCGCLYLETNTVQIASTAKFTRTLTAQSRLTINLYSATVTSGIATAFVTKTLPPLTSTQSVTLVPTPLSTGIIRTRSTSRSLFPPFNTTIPLPTVAISPSGLPAPATGALNTTSVTTKLSPATVRPPVINITSVLPTSVASITVPFNSQNATSVIRSTGFPSSIPSVTVPSGIFNITNSAGPTGKFPTLNTTLPSITASGSLNTSIIPSVFPTISLNLTNQDRDQLLKSCSALGLFPPTAALTAFSTSILPPTIVTSLTTRSVGSLLPPPLTVTSVITRSVGSLLPPPLTVTSVITRSVGSSISPPTTVTSIITRSVGTLLPPTATVTTVITRSVGNSIPPPLTVTTTSIPPAKTVTSVITTSVGTSIPLTTTVTTVITRSAGTSIPPPSTVITVVTQLVTQSVRTSILPPRTVTTTSIPPPETVTSYIESVTVITSTSVFYITSTISSTTVRTIRATPTLSA